MARPDLLALTEESLAALANAGLVRRGRREIDAGAGPELSEAPDGSLTGTFADGTRAEIPSGTPPDRARCSCPATGICRHVVMVVLALGARPDDRSSGPPAGPAVGWSPGRIQDGDLAARYPARTLTAARRVLAAGYRARVRRATAADPVPVVELPSCTVRFLVPDDLGYARVDAAQGSRDDAVALAVWAFRRADEVDPAAAVLDLDVRLDLEVRAAGRVGPDQPVGSGISGSGIGGSGIEPALPVLADLLAEGIAHAGGSLAPAIRAAIRVLDQAGLHWPVEALGALADQQDAYHRRAAGYDAERAAGSLAEMVARHRCAAGGDRSRSPDVLGTEQPAHTPLRLQRLVGLGAQVTADGADRVVEVYLAQPDAGIVLTLRRRIQGAGEQGIDEQLRPEQIGRRTVAGTRLAALAAGNVVTAAAVRSANRLVRISPGGLGRTSVTAATGDWGTLPAAVLVTDLAAEAARLAGQPPAVVRPRPVAEAIRAVVVEAVDDLRFLPGAQVLRATVRGPRGRATLLLEHASVTAGAVDAVAEALGGSPGRVRYIAGHLSRHGGEVMISPTALVVGDQVVVPAFASQRGGRIEPGDAGCRAERDPLAEVLGAALRLSADVVHRGWRQLPPGWPARVRDQAEELRRLGLVACAEAVGRLERLTAGDDPATVLDRWADMHLRLLISAERL